MAKVFGRERTFFDIVARPVERLIYRLTGIDEDHEMKWTEYAIAMLVFSFVTMIVTYAIERLQAVLPFQRLLNPQGFAAVEPALALNTAASFTTNTNWQAYAPRVDDELPDANGDAGLSQLCVSGRRHSVGHRVCARHCWPGEEDARQLLGGHDRATLWVLLPAASSMPWYWCRKAWFRTSGRMTRPRWFSRCKRR